MQHDIGARLEASRTELQFGLAQVGHQLVKRHPVVCKAPSHGIVDPGAGTADAIHLFDPLIQQLQAALAQAIDPGFVLGCLQIHRGLLGKPGDHGRQARPLEGVGQRLVRQGAAGRVMFVQIAEHVVDPLPGRQFQLPAQLVDCKWTVRIAGELGAADLLIGQFNQVGKAAIELFAAEGTGGIRIASRHDADAGIDLPGYSVTDRLFVVVPHVRDQQRELRHGIRDFPAQYPYAVRLCRSGLQVLHDIEHGRQARVDARVHLAEIGRVNI